MKITLTAGEASRIILNFLIQSGRIPTAVEEENIKTTVSNVTRVPGESYTDTEVFHYKFDLT